MIKQSQRGYVLVLVLVAILLVISLSALAIRQSLNDSRIAFASGKMNALFVAADAPLALLNEPDARQLLSADDGLMSALIAHHDGQYLTPSDASAPTVGMMCYDGALGLGNFTKERLSFDADSVQCTQGQALLWFVLSADDSQDFGYLPSGVAVDEIGEQNVSGGQYHLMVYSLATLTPITPCAQIPKDAKACLEREGVAHQMLAQEYDYGY